MGTEIREQITRERRNHGGTEKRRRKAGDYLPGLLSAGSGMEGGAGNSKTWMTPALITATRRPVGEIATFPPASRMGLRGATRAMPPLAASKTVTDCSFTSSALMGA